MQVIVWILFAKFASKFAVLLQYLESTVTFTVNMH